jgi:hypothetical protein
VEDEQIVSHPETKTTAASTPNTAPVAIRARKKIRPGVGHRPARPTRMHLDASVFFSQMTVTRYGRASCSS